MVALKLMKWSPWPSVANTRKFKVKVKPIKLHGFNFSGLEGYDANEKIVAIEMKWKGEQRIGLAPFGRKTFRQKQRNEFSSEKILKQGEDSESYADWDDEGFENTCDFTFTGRDQKLGPWDISFTILYGEKTKSKAKLRRIGKTCLNIAEMVAKEDIQVEKMLPINLHLGRVTTQAHLLVLLNFVELRGSEEASVESNGQTTEGVNNTGRAGGFFRPRRKSGNGELTELDSFDTKLNSVKKTTLFSWSRRHLSFKRPNVRLEGNSAGGGGGEKTSRCFSCVNDCTEDVQSRSSNSSSVDLVTSASGSHQKRKAAETLSESKSKLDEGLWESKEIMSRDGETKLKTKVFFASFDQCSNKAAGESACTALVAVIAHWLLSNKTSMPTRPVFDNLIIDGSSEWRKLCENDAYTNLFPDKHFDLETVLHADVRPIAVSRNDSFVGFFSPDKFESLKEAMSFDEIWSDIERISAEYDDDQQRIYIVSWNDHFFVLKVETNAYYIIDTLGERLFEGCNQAYILRFDDSTVMYGKTAQDDNNNDKHADEDEDEDDEEKERVICRGKECCKEFIKRFLASITIGELEAEEKKGAASYYSLHNRLQIELNFSYLVVSSSLTSSPFSNSSNSASYYSTE